MVEKKFCDRCGRETEKFFAHIQGEYNKSTSYPFSGNLCGDCSDSLRRWFEELLLYHNNPNKYVPRKE